MSYTEAEAFDYVARWADAKAEPLPLEDDEILDILDMCRLSDAAGVAPSEPAWSPTYWLPRAVAMCWELKAGRAAGYFDVTADRTTMSMSQVSQAYMRQAMVWKRRAAASANATLDAFKLKTQLNSTYQVFFLYDSGIVPQIIADADSMLAPSGNPMTENPL
jgi:hypothetical protein